MSKKFTVDTVKTTQDQPETIKALIEFLQEQEYRFSQAAYELGGETTGHLEAIEEDPTVPEEMYEEIYELVENSGTIEMAVSNGDRAAGEVQELIGKLEEEEKEEDEDNE